MLKPLLTGAAVTTLSLIAACGAADTDPRSADAPSTTTSTSPAAVEAAGPQPRLALTYDGGVLVLDATSGDVLADQPLEGFTRVSPAGDGRHVMIAAAGGFTALDLGSWTDQHGDHGHSWTTDPALTDFTVAAEEPGHVVAHEGRTTLFDDGTGEITSFATEDLGDLGDLGESGDTPELERRSSAQAHHGVAVQLDNGNLMQTVGDVDARTGIRVSTAADAELASSSDCPGVHGEAFAGEVAVFGCEDGALVVDGREITKVQSPDGYGRIGNQAGSETSAYAFGDYKTDADAELERPTRVSVIDTRDASLRLVDLPASYTFRSLGRTPSGDGLVLGTDGALHVVDTRRASVTASVPVLGAWEEPLDWQQPRPTLLVLDDTAYVTDPAARALHVVDLTSMAVTASHDLPQTPNELTGVSG